MFRQKFGEYSFSSNSEISESVLNELLHLLEKKSLNFSDTVLGGRSALIQGEVPGLGKVVVKHYSRGGLLRRFIKDFYFRIGKTRPEREYQLLKEVAQIGVLAPEPIAAIKKGSLLYQGWLAMKELPSQLSLADYCLENDADIEAPMHELTKQIDLLINNKIFHIDLHPGNAIVDQLGKVYVLDFDKAVTFLGDKNTLRDKYLCRWRRAVIKHKLPEILSELLCIGLRKNYDDEPAIASIN
ncbi:MAG: hypothetical protein KDD56_08375 [Bdellovibrionales bacterium]|nr:hypothetical protein [Bdellovibrionales bacterium]